MFKTDIYLQYSQTLVSASEYSTLAHIPLGHIPYIAHTERRVLDSVDIPPQCFGWLHNFSHSPEVVG